MLLPAPVEEEVILQGIARTRCADSPVFREFARHFGGCRDMIPGAYGAYCLPGKWETLFDWWPDEDGLPDWYAEWRSALVLYHSTGGDGILLHPTGKVAWQLFGEGEISPIAANFEGFLEYLVKYRTVMPPDLYRGEGM
jgi:hypothetical protein